jgi:phenylglyoxylate dehydrogenase epsilon subunit
MMSHSKYLIVGCSHAGLSALDAIRIRDREGSVTLLTREGHLPYSPTILPYVLAGQTSPDTIYLRYEEELKRMAVAFRQEAEVVSVDPAVHEVTLNSGEKIGYEKLLLATGAEPVIPLVDGLKSVPYQVLRTLEDAMRLRSIMREVKSAIVLGAGLIAMHAAENLTKAGKAVTVVVRSRMLRGYFDEVAGSLIQKIFAQNGINALTGSQVAYIEPNQVGCRVFLESGEEISGDMLIVATGVKPCTDYLLGSGIDLKEGILVNETMRTSVEDVWAAGDVAQAAGFFEREKKVDATLPSAVEQGRMAGMDMVGDSHLKAYVGGVPVNTYNFFGNRAFSAGLSTADESLEGIEVDQMHLPSSRQYQKMVFKEDCLVGIAGINRSVDPGIMYQLIRRQVDLKEVRAQFAAAPQQMGRVLMTTLWR